VSLEKYRTPVPASAVSTAGFVGTSLSPFDAVSGSFRNI
jgi:hypothetical protein